jgi:hypothetical protein
MAAMGGAGSNSVFGMMAGLVVAILVLFIFYYKRAIKIEEAQP